MGRTAWALVVVVTWALGCHRSGIRSAASLPAGRRDGYRYGHAPLVLPASLASTPQRSWGRRRGLAQLQRHLQAAEAALEIRTFNSTCPRGCHVNGVCNEELGRWGGGRWKGGTEPWGWGCVTLCFLQRSAPGRANPVLQGRLNDKTAWRHAPSPLPPPHPPFPPPPSHACMQMRLPAPLHGAELRDCGAEHSRAVRCVRLHPQQVPLKEPVHEFLQQAGKVRGRVLSL